MSAGTGMNGGGAVPRTPAALRGAILGAALISGIAALVLQIVWQRHLASLIGVEARSIALVIAVFLFGLATGYRIFGIWTARVVQRSTLLRLVAAAELGIAIWALAFPFLLGFVRSVVLALPDALAIDLLATAVLLVPPTFLMGATIPVLTAALPDRAEEVHGAHALLYGVNTVGACIGAFLGGLWLVPKIGLTGSLIVAAALDLLAAVVFRAITLRGAAQPADDPPVIVTRAGTGLILTLVFVSGAITIAVEVLAMRMLGLALGSGHFIFPVVVGTVVLGLALGSLSLRLLPPRASSPPRELAIATAMLLLVFLSIPHWSYWLSHVRVSLSTIPSNYPVFLFCVILFVAVLLVPLFFILGRLLPMGYALIDKHRDDYGRVCGRLYFVNTIGTAVGAVVLGYLMLRFLEVETILRGCVLTLAVLAVIFGLRERRSMSTIAAAIFAVLVIAAPTWPEHFRVHGYFRIRAAESFHFRSMLDRQYLAEEGTVVFLRDDPNATVAVQTSELLAPDRIRRWSGPGITVNGKSDGHVLYDYSNMVLSAIIPYAHARAGDELDALVVGLGTGLTSGALAIAPDVRKVVTLEITPAIIDAQRHFTEHNFGLTDHPKSRMVPVDAFRYLARTRDRYDIIVSEPSNPWVVGNENLFTPEFYDLAHAALHDEGIFFQWIQLYESDAQILSAIVDNVLRRFRHARLFRIADADVGIIASDHPLQRSRVAERLAQPELRGALQPLSISAPEHLMLLEVFDHAALESIAFAAPLRVHSLELPWLGHHAGASRFLGTVVDLEALLPAEIARHLPHDAERTARLTAWLDARPESLEPACAPTTVGFAGDLLCGYLAEFERWHADLAAPVHASTLQAALEAYGALRRAGMTPFDGELLARMEAAVADPQVPITAAQRRESARSLIRQLVDERQAPRARAALARLVAAGAIAAPEGVILTREIDERSARQERWFELRRAAAALR